MNERQHENEEKIFHAIQDLKDSIFGLKQSYVPYCYESSVEDGTVFSKEKTRTFVARLCQSAEGLDVFGDDIRPVLPLFFELCIWLLAAICGRGDWVFVSFRKLAKTAVKESPEEESVLDRIVSSHREELDDEFPDGEFWDLYERFSCYMGRVDAVRFFQSVKRCVERYLDEERLNVLDRDRMTASVEARISRLAASIERDLRRAEASWEDGE